MKTGVIIEFVDGSMLPYEGESFVEAVDEAKEMGRSGKPLIQAVFTNDWGAPPLCMKVFRDGRLIHRVPYE